MNTKLFALVGLVALAASTSVGCADTSPDPGDEAASEEDLTNRQLPGAVAVEIAEVRARTEVLSAKTIGAPKNVKSVLAGVKKLKPTDAVPRCLERDTTRLTFLDVSGQKLATVDSNCGGFGHISFEGGREGYGVKFDVGAVETAKDAPFAVGDALWGITKIELSKPGSEEKRTITGAGMTKILAGFNLDEVPDANASFPRCLPSHAVTLVRGEANVALTSFLCGSADAATAPASVKASFTAVNPAGGANSQPLARGGVALDPRPVIEAFSTKR